MRTYRILWLVIALLLVAGTIWYFSRRESTGYTESNSAGQAQENTGASAELLGGSESSPYLTFTQEAYERALAEDKIILLYFYANWCPICQAEQPHTIAAFDALENDNVIGFRVNYRDSATDDDEERLAEEFGITYQHTKVILKDGQQILKSLDSWDTDRYLQELNGLS